MLIRSAWAIAGTVSLTLTVSVPLSATASPAPLEIPAALPALPDLDVDARDFESEARQLPDELVQALERDAGLSGSEYLAQAALSTRALDAVELLRTTGISVSEPRLESGELVVTVESEREVDLLDGMGVTATVEESGELDLTGQKFVAAADLHGGAPYVYADGASNYRCSAGFSGAASSSGARRMLTAGHCLGDAGAPRRLLQMTRPGEAGIVSSTIGLPVSGTFRAGGGWDFGLVEVTADGVVSKPSVLTWGGGADAPLATDPLLIRDAARAITGATLCKSGSTTGWSCGPIIGVVDDAFVQTDSVSGDGYEVDALVSCIRLGLGDSGGAAVVGATAVGITSAVAVDRSGTTCGRSDATIGLFVPLAAPSPELQSASTLYGSGWEPLVAVARPSVTSFRSGETYSGNRLEGKLPFGSSRHRVEIVIDGGERRSVPVSSSGVWSVDISDLGLGAHTFSATARWGTRSASTATTGSWFRYSSVRISGDNRYATAAAISRQAFPDGARTVFIANGLSFPDALSAGPAAAGLSGPLLLTDPAVLPAEVLTELRRLDPDRIVVVGGSSVVGTSVTRALRALAPVERWSGDDRYATSREIARRAFADGAAVAYVATGASFPDALSAGAAGANVGAPVILVPGTKTRVDRETLDLLRELGVREVRIAGGPSVVSLGIASSIRTVVPTVRRLAGSDRYATSLAINADVIDDSREAYLTSGTNFPDALAGSVLAGLRGAPMYIASASCVTPGIVDHIAEIDATRAVLLGGTSVLSSRVARLQSC